MLLPALGHQEEGQHQGHRRRGSRAQEGHVVAAGLGAHHAAHHRPEEAAAAGLVVVMTMAIFNGAGRPTWGAISDIIGIRNAYMIVILSLIHI